MGFPVALALLLALGAGSKRSELRDPLPPAPPRGGAGPNALAAGSGEEPDPLAQWAGPMRASVPADGGPVQLASAPAGTETPTLPGYSVSSGAQAAEALAEYLRRGGNDRATIARFQTALSVTADGTAGPITAAHALGAYYGAGGRGRGVISAYQRILHVHPDGIVGDHTRAAAARYGVRL